MSVPAVFLSGVMHSMYPGQRREAWLVSETGDSESSLSAHRTAEQRRRETRRQRRGELQASSVVVARQRLCRGPLFLWNSTTEMLKTTPPAHTRMSREMRNEIQAPASSPPKLNGWHHQPFSVPLGKANQGLTRLACGWPGAWKHARTHTHTHSHTH